MEDFDRFFEKKVKELRVCYEAKEERFFRKFNRRSWKSYRGFQWSFRHGTRRFA